MLRGPTYKKMIAMITNQKISLDNMIGVCIYLVYKMYPGRNYRFLADLFLGQ